MRVNTMTQEQKVAALRRKLVRVRAERDAWTLGYSATGNEAHLRTATAYGNAVRVLKAKIARLSH